MSTDRNERLPFLFNPTFHREDARDVAEIELTFLDKKDRNPAQLELLHKLGVTVAKNSTLLRGANPLEEQCVCYEVDTRAQQIMCVNGEPAFREVLYLFNVLIALEWNPSRFTYQQIRLAAQRASDFLYDVTNGYMAIGHVIIGGPDLIPAADIEILASNRIHPRSWNGALNEAHKFKPIRIGRGLWQKNLETQLTWDTPEGYRALVHEWGHYAFALADEYLSLVDLTRKAADRAFWTPGLSTKPTLDYVKFFEKASSNAKPSNKWTETELNIAAPDVALPVQSVMANTQISEYSSFDNTFHAIQKYYPLIRSTGPLDGPEELPLGLPYIDLTLRPRPFGPTSGRTPSQAPLNLNQPTDFVLPIQDLLQLIPGALQKTIAEAQSHWLYLLKAPIEKAIPKQIIAQGKISRRDIADGFRLLGAGARDQVLVISQVGEQVSAHRVTLTLVEPGKPELQPGQWEEVSPPASIQAQPFFVDVLPQPIKLRGGNSMPMHANVCVSVTAADLPDDVRYYPIGAPCGLEMGWKPGDTLSDPKEVPHLDGHVLLFWEHNSGRPEGLFVCSCSQGGGGGGTSAGGRLPVTGGSPDGNAMVFFNVNVTPVQDKVESETSTMRLVTTTQTTSRATILLDIPGSTPVNAEARSYIFSLASNELFGHRSLDRQASLVLYYDQKARKPGGELLIYRWEPKDRKWVALTTFAPSDLSYLAVPLGVLDDAAQLGTAPALTRPGRDSSGQPRVERYQIFWTPSEAIVSGRLPQTIPQTISPERES